MDTQIIAHRGASKVAPENTLPAFEIAYKQGADGIETDVHLTKDQVPILIHDGKVNRTTNGNGYVKDFTYDEIKRLDAGSWFSSEFAGTTIISLESFLKWSQFKQLDLHIELKNHKIDYQAMEAIVYELINKYNLIDRTTLSTFHAKSLQKIKALNKTLKTAFLTSKRRWNIVHILKKIEADALHIKYKALTPALVKKCQQANIPIRVYTVNKEKDIMNCLKTKCTGIITDLPERALQCQKLFNSNNY